MGINLGLLRNKRIEKGLTQTTIAKNLHITEQAYSLKETGKRDFRNKDIPKICGILKITPNQLFNWE